MRECMRHGLICAASQGDEAILDDEGYLRIVGRLKDLVIRGGEVCLCIPFRALPLKTPSSQNLFPVQIENVLTAHPRIREAAVVAVPDEKFGEVVGVWIVRETDSDVDGEDNPVDLHPLEVRDWVRSRMNPQVSTLLHVLPASLPS